jgi:hypothetical protein
VRHCATEEVLQTVLKDSGFPVVRSITLLEESNSADIHRSYAMSNSESESGLLPIFFVKLKIEGGNSINFNYSKEELARATLKDAASEANRIAQSLFVGRIQRWM